MEALRVWPGRRLKKSLLTSLIESYGKVQPLKLSSNFNKFLRTPQKGFKRNRIKNYLNNALVWKVSFPVNERKIAKTNKNSFSAFQTEQFTVLWILFAVIVLGNVAVLVTLFINKSRKSRMNYFIQHLAIAGKSHLPPAALFNIASILLMKVTTTMKAERSPTLRWNKFSI